MRDFDMSELPTDALGLEETVAALIIRGVIITGATSQIVKCVSIDKFHLM
jgi:hypothetical protein